MAKTRAQENRAIRQEALREQLSKQKHVEQVIDCLNKLAEPGDKEIEEPNIRISRLKAKIDGHMRLVDKYLPSLKAVEHQGDLTMNHGVVILPGRGSGDTVESDAKAE